MQRLTIALIAASALMASNSAYCAHALKTDETFQRTDIQQADTQGGDIQRAGDPPAKTLALIDGPLIDSIEPIAAVLSGLLGAGLPQQNPFHALRQSYETRQFQPVWFSAGQGMERIEALRGKLRTAADEGLNPGRYALGHDHALNPRTPEALAALELEASLDFVRYIQDLQGTHPDSLAVRQRGMRRPEPTDPAVLLAGIAATADVTEHLALLAPDNALYASMREALVRYRALVKAGGWPLMPAGKSLELGDLDERIPTLRERLFVTGDLLDAGLNSPHYDQPLYDAVIDFQRRHGLAMDGIVGKRTQRALRMSAEERVEQIVANMERARWLPTDLGQRYVLVNVPGFALEIIEDGELVMDMAIIVGRRVRKTPIFSGQLTWLEINPDWNVPESIARKDLFPRMLQDPYYMVDEGLRLFDKSTGEELSRENIDWQSVAGHGGVLPFRMRQDPGPANALGRVKFMFKNPFAVYLHDTPSRNLFNKPVRTFSSGCIRVAKPMAMAEYLLHGKDGWERSSIEDAVNRGARTAVDLPQSVPVHLIYRTAWVGRDGRVQFRHDIYGRDAFIADKLLAKRATSSWDESSSGALSSGA